MDFKALRDLPSDPDAPNMEVLLAAAQRELSICTSRWFKTPNSTRVPST
jgi:hypothetical protein